MRYNRHAHWDGQQRQRTNIFFQLHPAVNQNGISYQQRTLSLAQDPMDSVFNSVGFLVHVIPATIPPRSAKRTATCSIDPLNLTVTLGNFRVAIYPRSYRTEVFQHHRYLYRRLILRPR